MKCLIPAIPAPFIALWLTAATIAPLAGVAEAAATAVNAAPRGATLTRVVGGGRTLMPGLIDNHVHVVMSASSQADLMDPKVSEAHIQARATAEAANVLMRGFTSVRDMGGPFLKDRAAIGRCNCSARRVPG